MGLAWALILNQPFRGRAAVRALSLVPWVLPSTVTAFVWGWIFNSRFGVLNAALVGIGAIPYPTAWLSTSSGAMTAIVVTKIWFSIPLFMSFFLAGLQSLDREQVDAARVDGAGNGAVLRDHVLPHLRPVLLVVVVLGVIGNLQHFDTIYALTGGGPVRGDLGAVHRGVPARVRPVGHRHGVGAGAVMGRDDPAGGVFLPAPAAEGRLSVLDLSSPLARTVFGATAALIGAFLFGPIYWLAISAFKSNGELYRIVPTLYPHEPVLTHFATAFGQGRLLEQLRNSLVVSCSAAAINTLLALYAGYSFAKFRYAGRRGVMVLLLSAQVFPFGLLLISLYPTITDAGLIDTRLGLILSYIVFALPVSTYMLYSYLRQVPSEMIEAARADGASELRIFHTIVLPVSIPAIVTVFLYGFMWSWNDLLYALTLIVSEDKRTIGPGMLLNYLNEVNADWGGAMAASIVASSPIVLAFAFLQRWFIQGVTAGSVK